MRRRLVPTFSERPNNSVLQWLQTECPQDLVRKVIALAGPQTAASLAKTNQYWKAVMDEEETWRALCEELYKWQSSDEIPGSWKQYYRDHPCIPVDFRSIDRAVDTLFPPRHRSSCHHLHSSVHFLFRPGRHHMWRTVLIHGTRGPIQVTFEKISCQQSGPLHQRRSRNNFDGDVFLSYDGPKSNCPLFCVENGVLVLRGLRLSHQSSGVDLWGGNAVIHVEARNGLAQVSVEGCDITSKSGRGIAISNGGKLTVNQSSIHSCAATGVYISDSNSTARIASTDIVFNGIGGQRLARGHSGVCLENNGTVSIRDCNISLNSGSGISIINTEVWRLNLSDSDVIGNGAKPLDFPNADADVLSSSIPALIRNGNRLDDSGPTRPRSALPHTWFLTAQQAVFEEFIDM